MTSQNALSKIQASVNNGAFEYYTVYDNPDRMPHNITASQPSYVTRDEALRMIGSATGVYQDTNPFMMDPNQWWIDGATGAGKAVSLALELDDVNPAVVLVGSRSLPWSG